MTMRAWMVVVFCYRIRYTVWISFDTCGDPWGDGLHDVPRCSEIYESESKEIVCDLSDVLFL